ncbi:fimbria/pilus periplasmic chaperone [Enterobacter cloacae]|nr:fimbria/pilus periplasmic chaperone [Enterobacter cloacae]
MFHAHHLLHHLYRRNIFISGFIFAVASSFAHASDMNVVQNTKVFKLELGATRIIYHAGERGAQLSVANPQSFPVLVQSRVFKEDRKTQAPFVVTPPLFRLDPNQRNTLRVISMNAPTGEKESLYWLCVTGIPPKNGDAWAEDKTKGPLHQAQVNMEISTHMCIKVITRPENITGDLMQAAASLQWHREGNMIRAKNNSPYYINLHSLSVGAIPVEHPEYIPPFSERDFSLKSKPGDTVNWTVITDAGGESRRYSAQM